jgi:copper resistance protein B
MFSKMMKTKHSDMFQKTGAAFSAIILLIIFVSSSLKAQKAPPFSNDLMMGNRTYVYFLADRLEYTGLSGANPLVWDFEGYAGKTYNKFWFRTEGNAFTSKKGGEAELWGMYSHAVTAYFNLQTGIRYDLAYGSGKTLSRGFAVIGVEGLAPYLFEVNGHLFVSQKGDVSFRIEGENDLFLTQRLIAQPRVGLNLAVQQVKEFGIGSGINNVELGFRLRYEIRRQFAPYIGISWNRKLGQTADFARFDDESVSRLGLVAGVRMWF